MVKLLLGSVLLVGCAAMLLQHDDEVARREAAKAEVWAASQAHLAARFCPAHFDDALDLAGCFQSFGVAHVDSAGVAGGQGRSATVPR